MSQALQWICKSETIKIHGVKYSYGNTLPVDDMDPDEVARLQALKKIGHVPLTAPDKMQHLVTKVREFDAVAKDLRAENTTLRDALEKSKEKCAGLSSQITELNAAIDAAQKRKGKK